MIGMETFADVLHAIIDTVFSGEVEAKAHSIIDQASGPRTVADAPPAEEPPVVAPPADPAAPPADTPPPSDTPPAVA